MMVLWKMLDRNRKWIWSVENKELKGHEERCFSLLPCEASSVSDLITSVLRCFSVEEKVDCANGKSPPGCICSSLGKEIKASTTSWQLPCILINTPGPSPQLVLNISKQVRCIFRCVQCPGLYTSNKISLDFHKPAAFVFIQSLSETFCHNQVRAYKVFTLRAVRGCATFSKCCREIEIPQVFKSNQETL